MPWQRLKDKEDFHVLLMGATTLQEGNAYEQELHGLVRSSGLESRVHFRKYTDDVMTFFKAIDVFAMPSHGETFGMVTVEAMAAGVPVIGTDKDGTREILGAGRFGYLFEKQNEGEFISKLKQSLSDPNKPAMLKAAQGEAFSKYDFKKMVSEIICVLEKLISG